MFLFLVVLFFQIGFSQEVANKKYSYVCLKANDNLCFGVSPGPKVIEEPLDLQLKLRIRNENNGLDVFKTRYDVVLNVTGTFTSSANSKYCVQRTEKRTAYKFVKDSVTRETPFSIIPSCWKIRK